MGVFNSVDVLKPINKTAANGIASGSLVSEWRTPTQIKHCVVTNVKKREKKGAVYRERRGDKDGSRIYPVRMRLTNLRWR